MCTGLRSPCFGKCDSKPSSISDCLLSESVPSDLSLNISQSHGQGELEVPAKGTSESVLHTCGYDCDNYSGLGKIHSRYAIMDLLPDNVLLEIFDFWGIIERRVLVWPSTWKWYRFVHVCRRWRRIALASPKRLKIQLYCVSGTPVKTHLSCWRAFPISIDYFSTCHESLSISDECNLLSALEHSDRICDLDLAVSTTQLRKLVKVMQKSSYQALKYLGLVIDGSDVDSESLATLPDGFLNGSVPRLRHLELESISFPALPALLASTSDLVDLHLYEIPKSGYISPEAMAAGLATLPRLEDLFIGFASFDSLPHRISLPLVSRVVLPALTSFEFEGYSDYLEDLVAQIDCPKLKKIKIWYFYQYAGFQAAQLFEFINSSEGPWLRQFRRLDIRLVYDICLHLSHTIDIILRGAEWGLSHIIQLFDQFSTKLCDVRHLSIGYYRRSPEIDRSEWVRLLHPFTAAQTLYVCRLWVEKYDHPRRAITGDMGIEEDVLPALGLLCIDCPQSDFLTFFENFVTSRQQSGRPVTTVRFNWEFQDKLRRYLSEEDKKPFR